MFHVGLHVLPRDLLPAAADHADELLQLGRRAARRREGIDAGHRQRARRLQVPRVRKEVAKEMINLIYILHGSLNQAVFSLT